MAHKVTICGLDTNKLPKLTAKESEEYLKRIKNGDRPQVGDKEYALTYPIAQGEYVNLFKLSNWVGKELDVTKENITGTFADIAVGDTLTFDATTFKFKEDTATTGDICFTVMELLTVGVRVLVTVAA